MVCKLHEPQCLPDLLVVVVAEWVDVVAQGSLQQHMVLWHHANCGPERAEAQALRVDALEQHPPAPGLQDPQDGEQQRRLPAAGGAHDAGPAPARNREGHALQHVAGSVRVARAEVLDLHLDAVCEPAALDVDRHLVRCAEAEFLRDLQRARAGRVDGDNAVPGVQTLQLRATRGQVRQGLAAGGPEGGLVGDLLQQDVHARTPEGHLNPAEDLLALERHELAARQAHHVACVHVVRGQLLRRLLGQRHVLVEPVHGDNLVLRRGSGVDQVLDRDNDREDQHEAEVGRAHVQARARHPDHHQGEAGHKDAAEDKDAVVEPALQHGLAQKARADHVAERELEDAEPVACLAVGTDQGVAALHLRELAINRGLADLSKILEWHCGPPVEPQERDHEVVVREGQKGEPDRHHEVHIRDRHGD
mmetsp:Transcript_98891/g.280102  ORF Transcript_98891/g.280102 Transcript_98891/m.280102 type:complete len:419 (-) Transcript_98891:94-1350(-)